MRKLRCEGGTHLSGLSLCVCVCVCFLFGVRALGAWFYCRRRFQVLFHNYLFVCGFSHVVVAINNI